MKTIYLAGYTGEFSYREYCLTKYSEKFTLIDPISQNDIVVAADHGIDLRHVTSNGLKVCNEVRDFIVEEDKRLIQLSDYLIAYVEIKTFGTIMEIVYAYENDIPVYIINPSMEFENDIWLSYHTEKIFNNIDDCFEHLEIV